MTNDLIDYVSLVIQKAASEMIELNTRVGVSAVKTMVGLVFDGSGINIEIAL